MFKYHNENPNGYEVPDCVIRAIKLACNIPSYYDVVDLLKRNGDEFNCDELCVCCYEKLLDYDFKLPHLTSSNKTVEEVAKDFPYNTLLIRMDGHITVSINSVIHDIWDCSYEFVTDFWIVR